MTLNVGIVGFGVSGRTFHAPLIRAAGMRVTAIVARRSNPGAGSAEVQWFSDIADLLSEAAVDLVVIATPNHLHVEQASAALRAGRHVVIDKPAALTASHLDTLFELERLSDRKVAVFHNRRWDSDFLTLQRLLKARELGEVSAFYMRWDRFRPQITPRWREYAESGGGVLLDLGSHMVDQVLTLFGRPDWLQATIMAQRQGAIVDDAFEILMGRGPLLISLGVSSLAAESSLRYRVLGAGGSFLKRGLDVQEQQLRDSMDPLAAEYGREPSAQYGSLVPANGETTKPVPSVPGCWTDFYHQIRVSIENGAPVPVSLGAAQDVIMILDAARQSSATGTRVYLEWK
jgi:scyllo-inositol 2-dehydrogenase (NADP+)